MKYYYQYVVTYLSKSYELKAIIMSADNPNHLLERFYKNYSGSTVINYTPYTGITNEMKKKKREITLNNDSTHEYIESLSKEEIINSSVSDVYNEYLQFCLNENLDPEDSAVFSKLIINYFGLKSKVCKINKRSVRVYKEA